MKRIFVKTIFVLFVITMIFSSYITVAAETQPFDINAKAAILMDASTGTILYEKNIHEALPPASVTKIMTMLLTMEAIEANKITLADKVVVSERASSMGGTQLYLEPGEVKTVEDLIKGMAIRSANDACVAIGEHLAGSEEGFVEQMNARAKELGMKNTHFVNTNGLPAEGHVTSAYDIALMSRELLKHKEIHKWLTTWMDTVDVGIKNVSTQELVNTNKLIRTYKGANGIKTGSTSEAKYCLSASATRGNTTYIAVILTAPTSPIRFSEAAKLLDYGFANYNTVKVVEKGGALGTVAVEKGKNTQANLVAKDDLSILVKKGEESKVKKEMIIPQSVKAPIMQGEKIGEVIVTLEGKEVGKVDIIGEETIESASIIDILTRMFQRMVGH
ncbi:D-alanyl-D-alanine carboxypeptidase family protein [Clostridium formicaceticum]|uniref:serine-type D-Ala-D-Ala carboxypeptidase n=1 Tax=Clostridium formicaceticum TaxID=1497 RepID=A0AAC9WG95_9CLOT|nr:D-alanyl-D-alanine carboxypeptidase family protein [Clostridium formicaceticum]AOY77092.1 D-alanyl-D-alanine carboxypeptidase [Clostridium formicaceticum]ARE87601.1 D-alanyl-D-alanine carboxypeptidase DacF precursor [Clostridium formicaceticum]